MAKPQKSKSATSAGQRNSERSNGKAWSRHSKSADGLGHRITGRSKPTGRTVGGHLLSKLGERSVSKLSDGSLVIDPTVLGKVRESRRHSHRASLRRQRRVKR